MTRTKIKWQALETFGLYFSSIVFVLWKAFTMIWPAAYTGRAQAGQMILLGTTILGTLIYLIKQLEKLGINSHVPQFFTSFSEGFTEWLKDIRDVEDLDICAYTSHTYREALWATRKKIGRVRLLLFYPTDDFPTIEGAPDESVSSIKKTIDLWKTMSTGPTPQIAKLEIRQRRYNATLFFSVVNKEKTLHGILFPRKSMGGLEPRGVFVLSKESASMREQTALLREWFEEMWSISEIR